MLSPLCGEKKLFDDITSCAPLVTQVLHDRTAAGGAPGREHRRLPREDSAVRIQGGLTPQVCEEHR